MLKGFKDFLMRGNVVDLAVAVIVGTAFTAIVTALADNFIKPLIAAFGGTKVTGLSWTIVSGNDASRIDFAAVITALINFLIVASVVYFLIVMPIKKLEERRKRGEEVGPSGPTDLELLTEIRDLLRQQQGAPQQQGAVHQQVTGQSQGYPQQVPPPNYQQQIPPHPGYQQHPQQHGYPPQQPPRPPHPPQQH